MLLGDTHGNTRWATAMVDVAQRRGCDLILQLGDFGLWPGYEGLKYRQNLNTKLKEADLEMWVTGGNHDDYDQVDLAYEYDGMGELDVWSIESNIKWLPRGYRFELDGIRFLSLGGAYSIDEMWRTPHRSWWPQEQITQADVDRCLNVQETKVDVMLTHDKPRNSQPAWNRKDIAKCLPNQDFIQTVVNECRPKFLFHGHLHFPYYDRLMLPGGWVTGVHGLDCDGSPNDQAYAITDTEDLKSLHAYEATITNCEVP